MARKTVNVEDVVTAANAHLANDHPAFDASFRIGVAAMLETVLFRTGNYKGYGYLPSEWDESAGRLRDGYDHTRRVYR